MITRFENRRVMMYRLTSFVFIMFFAAISFGTAQGQAIGSIYISDVAGDIGQDTLGVGQPIVWTLNLYNANNQSKYTRCNDSK